MEGSVILTGANGSTGIHAVEYLLRNYPQFTAILTVRDPLDTNTELLRDAISRYPTAKASVHQLDLASLSEVHDFAGAIAVGISTGQYPPLSAIICNAYYWNLVGDPEPTRDGYDKTFQVTHIGHVALVLRLVGQFTQAGGRITIISSNSHWPGKNSMERYPAYIPGDLDLLVNPSVNSDKYGCGYQRYANAKLALTTWMYALNRYLQKDTKLSNITAVAIDPGAIVDSRGLHTNTPLWMIIAQKLTLPFLPLVRLVNPAMRDSTVVSADIITLALGRAHPGERGYFTLLKRDDSSPQSRDEHVQEMVWAKSAELAKVNINDTGPIRGS